MKIDVCIATYRRPEWLRLLLHDLDQQQMRQDCSLRWIVVDNDPDASARPVVEARGTQGPPLLYLTQPQKNIALTRNMALDHCQADWVAFVDDDERVPPDWLQTLLEAQRRFEADAVLGPVEGQLPAAAPAWVRRGGFFAARSVPSGTPQHWGATNNALVRASYISAGARFEPRFGLTGGEDTAFFYGLSRQGARLVWCQEALITEHVPPDRTTLRWLMRRNFRGGQCFADIVDRPLGLGRRLAWGLRCGALLATSALLALCTLPFSAGTGLRYAVRAAGSAGRLSSVLAYRFQEYR
jgi:succinoglycan biosynthesis protein ExoM